MQVISLRTILVASSLILGAPTIAVTDMQHEINQAATILARFQAIPEKAIPKAVFDDARGLAILTVTKAGFVVSGRGGTGVVVARTPQGWSGPAAIGTGGAGFGFQAGARVTEFVIVLNTDAAVQAFAQGGNFILGTDLSVAAGPVGRTAEAGVMPMAAIYTYSRSQGLFAGISLEGIVIGARDEINAEYYGHPVPPEDILSGKVSPPSGAQRLHQQLAKY